MRVAIITVLAVAAMAGSVLYASAVQRDTAERHAAEDATRQNLLTNVHRSESALESYALTANREPLVDRDVALRGLERGLMRARRQAEDNGALAALVARQSRLIEALDSIASRALSAADEQRQRALLRVASERRHANRGPDRNDLGGRHGAPGPAPRRRGPPRIAGRTDPDHALGTRVRHERAARHAQRPPPRPPARGEPRQAGEVRRGHAGGGKPDRGARAPEGAPRAVDRRAPRDRPQPQQQRRPPRGDHAGRGGVAARRAPPGGPPALLHGRPPQPPVRAGRARDEIFPCAVCAGLGADDELRAAARRRRGDRLGPEHHDGDVDGEASERISQSVAQSAPGTRQPAQPRHRGDAGRHRRADRPPQPPRRGRHAAADARPGRPQLRPAVGRRCWTSTTSR